MRNRKNWSRRRRILTYVGIVAGILALLAGGGYAAGILTYVGLVVGILALLAGGGYVAAKMWIHREFPKLDAASAEAGEWYSVHPEGAVDARGHAYHANVKVGSENKVLIAFNGGGVSVDNYTEARPATGIFSGGFYTVLDGFDMLAKKGLASDDPENPFRDWTVIQFPYSTGDFHAGAGDNTVEGLDGEDETIHHAGFTNLQLVLDDAHVKEVAGNPTDLLISGGSAGGFAAAIDSEEIMRHFPDTSNVTTYVDSSLLLYDWHTVSTDVWKSPEAISDVLTTNNFTLDALTALPASHPDVKILFASSVRDEALARMQSYLNGGEFDVTAQDGIEYEAALRQMVKQLQDQVPGIGLYIFEGKTDGKTGLTQHTIGSGAQVMLAGKTTPLEWIADAVNGEVASYGLSFLD